MNRKCAFIFLALAEYFAASAAWAQGTYIVNSGTISQITSTQGNGQAFAVVIPGGTGPCANSVITFTQSAAPDADTFKRAYAAALLAFAANSPVTIYNYVDSTCDTASYIAILR